MNKPKNVVFSEEVGQPLEVDIYAVPGWDGFDKLIEFLKNEYSVEVINRIDGPDARCWVLRSDGEEFELRHEDPYGNSIVASTVASEDIVRKIGLDLQERLKHL
ncbi:DUF3630 family protein [Aestuariispira ectoiniformans]|uniref:DUF3630 family protein n=1 Tax=Aestuariispira ectoiniformans TaxID=2775080 RepID=UPI00223BB6C7|nr:DUF3630 family protein [Aestuariispira ectoiniformans]